MKYLILMFFKYYRRGKQTKNIAYFSSITGCYTMFTYSIFLFDVSLKNRLYIKP